ncbi:hypothetical protein F442_15331 [Phytophthora nicotianae P10297]|uniref:Uncharacterized protein n=2 Tax=Phytophthora nicotianae TaxID=4792 RepID=V9ELF7_PHYNI|nr:hypothetical protein F443_15481 [Phytophthora nicotianae P1569]ETP36805.1 hypothetical protein F442_15331 [Phytophthora nicotianae P10297]
MAPDLRRKRLRSGGVRQHNTWDNAAVKSRNRSRAWDANSCNY